MHAAVDVAYKTTSHAGAFVKDDVWMQPLAMLHAWEENECQVTTMALTLHVWVLPQLPPVNKVRED